MSLKDIFSKIPSRVLGLLVLLGATVLAGYLFFKISDPASYFISATLFFVGVVFSYNIAATAGFDAALAHFREVVIGSTNIGLVSIKRLSDSPPEEFATKTKSSLRFMGIAGDKFLREALESGDFFRRNKNPQLVKIMLMDPFSDDIERLSGDKKQQEKNREKIISTIKTLSDLRDKGFSFDVRLYPKKPPLRLLIVDDCVTALSVYSTDSTGWKNAQLIFEGRNNEDSLAPYFVETFDDLWERGINFNLDQRARALSAIIKSTKPNEEVKLGMVHGRFQPFHHEHFEYVLHGISRSEKCLIGITQPNIKEVIDCEVLPHRGTAEGNPYTFEERKRMITLSLEKMGIPQERYEIIPFEIDNPEKSLPSLKKLHTTPINHFMRIFGEWELHKKKILEDHQMKVSVFETPHSDYMTKNVTGTLVRELISSKRNWADLVPWGTKKVINARLTIRG